MEKFHDALLRYTNVCEWSNHDLFYHFQLCDLLIKPVQRIQKYHLLVRDVLRHSERANVHIAAVHALRQAAHITARVPKAANDMMDVGRLQGFDVSASYTIIFRGHINPSSE